MSAAPHLVFFLSLRHLNPLRPLLLRQFSSLSFPITLPTSWPRPRYLSSIQHSNDRRPCRSQTGDTDIHHILPSASYSAPRSEQEPRGVGAGGQTVLTELWCAGNAPWTIGEPNPSNSQLGHHRPALARPTTLNHLANDTRSPNPRLPRRLRPDLALFAVAKLLDT